MSNSFESAGEYLRNLLLNRCCNCCGLVKEHIEFTMKEANHYVCRDCAIHHKCTDEMLNNPLNTHEEQGRITFTRLRLLL